MKLKNFSTYSLLSCSLLSCLRFSLQLSAIDNDIPSIQSEVFRLSHIEGNGIGYQDGYTTAEVFLPIPLCNNVEWLPFTDLRGHVFDDGQFAANAGLGLRFLNPNNDRVLGFNTFYDYRQTHRMNCNQLGFGFESLGCWDFRFNCYLPVGAKKTSKYDYEFAEFKGNYAYIAYHQQFAMRGFDVEIGTMIASYQSFDIYTAVGSYYLGDRARNAIGGKARAKLCCWDYVDVEVSGSYDNLFKGIVQGRIGFNIPFGPTQMQKNTACCSHVNRIAQYKRAIQPVERQEIIVVDRKSSKKIARDPVSNLPINFLFINNTSVESDGTFEHPYSTLTEALAASNPNDKLYLYQGDGSANGMNNGIILKNNQALWGAGIDHVLLTNHGPSLIPAQSTGMPLIINPTGTAITLANSNEVSGIHIGNSFTGISGFNIVNTNINNNLMTVTEVLSNPLESFQQISLLKMKGDLSIVNNQFLPNQEAQIAYGILLQATTETGKSTINISQNTFENHFIGVEVTNNGQSTLIIDDNSLTVNPIATSIQTAGVLIFNFGSGKMDTVVSNNHFLNQMTPISVQQIDKSSGNISTNYNHVLVSEPLPASYPIVIQIAFDATANCTVLNNHIETSSEVGTMIGPSFTQNANAELKVEGNTLISHNDCAGIIITTEDATKLSGVINNNHLPTHSINLVNGSSNDINMAFTNNFIGTFGIEIDNSGGNVNAIIDHNEMVAEVGFVINEPSASGDINLCFTNNSFEGFSLTNSSTKTFTVRLDNNVGPITEKGPIEHATSGICPQ